MTFVLEYPNILSNLLCEDIICLYDEENDKKNTNIMNIPKNSDTWDKIERILYKNVLIKINEYKINMVNKNNDIVSELSKTLKLTNFTIQKYDESSIPINFSRINSRKNIVTFILFLNKVEGGEIIFKKTDLTDNTNTENYIVRPEIGKLIIFPDDINHIFKIQKYKGSYYVISNQICYN